MNTTEMKKAVSDAEVTLRAADNCADDLAYILIGRLRKGVSTWKLSQLKKELANYNIHTGKWKP